MEATYLESSSAFDSGAIHRAPILIVDDEQANLDLLQNILSRDGYSNITCVNSSAEVLDIYRLKRPSLILLDINMPGLNGFGVIEMLKEEQHIKLPPVVFITGEATHESRVKAFDSGVLDYISKPFSVLELLSRVKNLLALEAAYRALENRNQSLEEMVNKRTQELWATKLEVVQKLGRAAEYRDNDTGAHILRMSHTASLIARHMGLGEAFAKRILYASPMHDIGKIAIPDNILLKPGSFTPDEWEIMKSHTTLGAKILEGGNSELMQMASEIALSHHEKWDGSGYPHNLPGHNIPVSCRIVAVADVFDALVSQRPYKQAWTLSDALGLINEQAGQHFDPSVVDVFNRIFDQVLEIQARYQDPEYEGEGIALASALHEIQAIG